MGESSASLSALELTLKANQMTDESLEATRRMRGYCEDARDSGITALVHLDHQGDQLDNIETSVGQVKEDMKQAEKSLRSLDRVWGVFPKFWKKPNKGFRDGDADWTDEKVFRIYF